MKKNYSYTYRRRILDYLLEKHKYLYHGVVLDIGGRDRGYFRKPKKDVEKWIFADINTKYNPDVVLNVMNMEQIESNSIDVINAIELFEHVQTIQEGLKECYRVLKKDGIIILSSPFLYPIHADPYDFQRWTHTKWQLELKEVGFKITKFIITGKFFMNLAEMLKFKLRPKKKVTIKNKILNNLFHPFLNYLIKFDGTNSVKNNPILNNYHNGYFIIAKK